MPSDWNIGDHSQRQPDHNEGVLLHHSYVKKTACCTHVMRRHSHCFHWLLVAEWVWQGTFCDYGEDPMCATLRNMKNTIYIRILLLTLVHIIIIIFTCTYIRSYILYSIYTYVDVCMYVQ